MIFRRQDEEVLSGTPDEPELTLLTRRQISVRQFGVWLVNIHKGMAARATYIA
jgi:hypothetical protein